MPRLFYNRANLQVLGFNIFHDWLLKAGDGCFIDMRGMDQINDAQPTVMDQKMYPGFETNLRGFNKRVEWQLHRNYMVRTERGSYNTAGFVAPMEIFSTPLNILEEFLGAGEWSELDLKSLKKKVIVRRAGFRTAGTEPRPLEFSSKPDAGWSPGSNATLRRALLEVWITAQAAVLEVTPRQYCVALVPNMSIETDKDKEKWQQMTSEVRKGNFDAMCGSMLDSIIYVAEAYTSDCDKPYLLKWIEGDRGWEFWNGCARMAVHAARNGLVHGDLKPRNAVYRRENGKYTVKLIDLDPGFVSFLDMDKEENRRFAPCLALLTFAAFVTSARCLYRNDGTEESWDAGDEEHVGHMARAAMETAIGEEWGIELWPRIIQGLRLRDDFGEIMCGKIGMGSTRDDQQLFDPDQEEVASADTIIQAMFHNYIHYIEKIAATCLPATEPTLRTLIEVGLVLDITGSSSSPTPRRSRGRGKIPAAGSDGGSAPLFRPCEGGNRRSERHMGRGLSVKNLGSTTNARARA